MYNKEVTIYSSITMSEHPPKVSDSSYESQDDTLELQEYQAITPEQEETMLSVADIERKINTLVIIENSIKQKNHGYNEHTNVGSEIERLNQELIKKTAEGEDVSGLEADLFQMKNRYNDGEEFYGEHGQNSTMLNRTGAEELNKLRGKEEEIDESTQALLATLEELGLDIEKFKEELNQGPEFRTSTDRESYKVSYLVNKFKSGLQLQRNTERLKLPNEQERMVGELMQQAGVTDLDITQIRRSLWRKDEKHVAESLYAIIPEPKDFDVYPDSVKESYFVQVSSRLMEDDRRAEAEALGKQFAQMHIKEEVI